MFKPDDLAEEQLQLELQEMFLVDTQQQLETYFDLAQMLTPTTWVADIQHIYRAIHTIKGGAVTVAANEMMQAATVLEDLLSDLRYLEVSPPLADGQLSQMLLEAGELLASCLDINKTAPVAIDRSQLTIQRLTTLHSQIQEIFLSDWDEMRQVHQEFAEQGFDLVVLELEISLSHLPPNGPVTTAALTIGNSLLEQLRQIGQDLDLAAGWTTLLANCQILMDSGDSQEWQLTLPAYFVLLKQCAKDSGKLPTATVDDILHQLATIDHSQTSVLEAENIEPDDLSGTLCPWDHLDLDGNDDLETSALDLDWLAAENDDDDAIDDFSTAHQLSDALLNLTTPDSWDQLVSIDESFLNQPLESTDFRAPHHTPELITTDHFGADNLTNLLDDFFGDPAATAIEIPTLAPIPPAAITEQVAPAFQPEKITNHRRNIQIPVALHRLDKSAQQVVDTLLTTRGVTSQSHKLRSQLAQLTSITAESAQFTTKLRQLQDDYALLRNISDEQETSNNLTLERYRQGYTTINRLLENVLRMSELGREIETSTRQTFDHLSLLNRQIFSLKNGIEVNRLVPFRNLTMRARAILRDLTNRYGKAVALVVKNDQIELDAGVVQQLEPALLHLLRNAYDHGIESVAERLALGKPAQGQINLALQRRGNLYRLIIQDDGQGINADHISTQAIARRFTKTNASTDAELLAVICQPGFSSRVTVNEMSGRGVGMDVVTNQIAALGGKISLQTQLGIGSTFTIEVPALQLLVSCVLLQAGDRTIALPTEEILETVLLSATDIQLDVDQQHWQISTYQGVVPGFSLAAYWHQFSATLPETAVGLRCRLDNGSDIWLIADDLLEQSQLLINALPSPLLPPVGMLGVSLQPDGSLISVLDPIAITQSLRDRSISPITNPITSPLPTTTILVVDDAALMRRRLSSSLTNAGFAVQACGDGLEALQWLQANEQPAMIITDVEMPNMDGLTLIDRCRSLGMQVPILVVSSRLLENWGKEAQRVGANEFLNKGFTTHELLSMVEQLLATQTPSLV
jgi:chemotaxis protein histidine kinase CheA/ActR/RegA family two-component response regulator